VDKFATFSERPKAKCFSFRGGRTLWLGALPLDPAGGFAQRPPIIRESHLYLGASNSLTPALSILCLPCNYFQMFWVQTIFSIKTLCAWLQACIHNNVCTAKIGNRIRNTKLWQNGGQLI